MPDKDDLILGILQSLQKDTNSAQQFTAALAAKVEHAAEAIKAIQQERQSAAGLYQALRDRVTTAEGKVENSLDRVGDLESKCATFSLVKQNVDTLMEERKDTTKDRRGVIYSIVASVAASVLTAIILFLIFKGG